MSEIKFGTDGWRAIIAKDFTVANVARVARASALWIKKNQPQRPRVVIGYDCRFGGRLFMETAIGVFCEEGLEVYAAADFVSTPMVSLGASRFDAGLGVVITASHNPPSYNGYKLKDHRGGPASPETVAQVEALIPGESRVPNLPMEEWARQGKLHWVDLESLYVEEVEKKFDMEAIRSSGIRVAYDPMYGAGQRVMKRILPTARLIHADYNPGFHGQAPEPILKNLQELASLIAGSGQIDLGLATDGDADRIGLFDENGKFTDAHHIILLLIHYLFKYKGLRGKVVVAFSTSIRIKKLCDAYGIPLEITKIGFKYISGPMATGEVIVGGEESGGIAVMGHIPERDGIWDGLVIMEFMARTGKKLSELIEEVYEVTGPFAYDRMDLHLPEEKKQAVMKACAEGRFKAFGPYAVEMVEQIDGYKFYLPEESTLMIRPSGTEPLLRVYCEAGSEEQVREILKAAKESLLQ